MVILLVGVHVLVCFFLIFVVLLQSAQAADLAGAFGGGGSQTALGMRSATTVLQKATTGAAVLFMLTSLGLGLFGGQAGSSVIEGLEEPNVPASMAEEEQQEPDGAAEDGGEQGDGSAADGGTEQQEDGGR